MSVIRWTGSAFAAVAMMTMAVAPADAQRRGGHHHHRGDRISGGDVLLGAIIAGGLIALVSSSNKRSRDSDGYDAPPPPPRPSTSTDAPPPEDSGYQSDQDTAINRCATAAEDMGRRYSQIARVVDVGQVDPARGGGYYVNGTIELSQDYRQQNATRHGFRCAMLGGGSPQIVIDGIS